MYLYLEQKKYWNWIHLVLCAFTGLFHKRIQAFLSFYHACKHEDIVITLMMMMMKAKKMECWSSRKLMKVGKYNKVDEMEFFSCWIVWDTRIKVVSKEIEGHNFLVGYVHSEWYSCTAYPHTGSSHQQSAHSFRYWLTHTRAKCIKVKQQQYPSRRNKPRALIPIHSTRNMMHTQRYGSK